MGNDNGGSKGLSAPPWEGISVSGDTTVALGLFDGVHLGHQEILRRTKQAASDFGTIPVVFSFQNHPKTVVGDPAVKAPRLLVPVERRIELIRAAGIDCVIVPEFDRAWADTPAVRFARDFLSGVLHAKHVVVGFNYCFGKGAEGRVTQLQEFGKDLGFTVEVVPAFQIDGDEVSSTRIRSAVVEGRMEDAARLLGRPHELAGSVMRGDGRGRTLGYPTANLDPELPPLLPHGVYGVEVILLEDGEEKSLGPGMFFIGPRKTFKEEETEATYEVHLLDFEGDLYGKRLRLGVLGRIRGAMKFAGPDEFTRQLESDRAACAPYFKSIGIHPPESQEPPGHQPLLNTQLSRVEQAMVINRLIVIHQLSLTLQTQLDQERLLRIMLSGITAGEALGFNRALVFLLDDTKQFLVGALGVGPINEEECRHVWQCIAEHGLKLADFIDEFGQLTRYQTAAINIRTQEIRWRVREWDDLLTRTLREKTCFHVTPDQFGELVPPPVAELLETQELVVSPLVVTGNALGVVVADNKFSGRPITEQDIQLLSIVANQTAAALSHIRLIKELERFQDHLEEKVREAVFQKERAMEDMIRRAKLASVGEMAVTVAHEIRNPLTAVRGFAQRLHRKYEDPEKVHDYAEIILTEVDRLNSVLGDVLDFARNVDTKFSPVNLNQLVERTVKLLEQRMGANNVIVETELDPEMPTCYYDDTQLTQVLINLMKNGAHAMKMGGVLLVRTAAMGAEVLLEVADTGEGINPKNLKRIFEPFFTTKTQGTGLGLAFAKRVIQEHGGEIYVESAIGKGTTFRIQLPARLEAPDVQEVIESLDMANPMVNPNDLLVVPRTPALSKDEGVTHG